MKMIVTTTMTAINLISEVATPSSESFTTTNLSIIYLEDANIIFSISLLPTLLYLHILIIMGVVGNTLIFSVYYKRFEPSAGRTYIITMSVCDLMANCTSLPGEILEIRFYHTFDNPSLCRCLRFLKSFFSLSSSFILVAIANDRRRKICNHVRSQPSRHRVYISVVVCLAVAMSLSIPYSILSGRQTVKTEYGNATGVRCSIDDAYVNSTFFLVHHLLLFMALLTCVAILVFSYSSICRKIWLHQRRQSLPAPFTPAVPEVKKPSLEILELGHQSVPARQDSRVSISDQSSEVPSNDRLDRQIFFIEEASSAGHFLSEGDSSTLPTIPKNTSSKASSSVKKIPTRTTFMMCLLTAVYIINYFPYLFMNLINFSRHYREQKLSNIALNASQIALRSYFLNCAVNIIIYSVCSARFRQECCRLLHCKLKLPFCSQ